MKRYNLNRWQRGCFVLLCGVFCLSFMACGGTGEGADTGVAIDTSQPPTYSEEEQRIIQTLSPLPQLPPSPSNKYADNPKAVLLGQYLFYDKGYSEGGSVSCATCHAPDKQWADALPFAQGLQKVTRHTPTLWNLAYNRWFYWDGRKDTIWSQALNPVEAAKEMGASRLSLLHYVTSNAPLKKAYTELFGDLPDTSDTKRFPKKGMPVPKNTEDPLHKAWISMSEEDQKTVNLFFTNIGKAFEAFQRKLVSKESPFDTFVEGLKTKDASKLNAISNEAKWGLQLFVQRDSCIACHNGPNFSDGEFHNIGLDKHPDLPEPDIGRFDGIPEVLSDPFNGLGLFSDAPTHPVNDKLRFLKKDPQETVSSFGEMKTPTLRNVALSAPYMHDGRFANLDEVIAHYSTFGAQNPANCFANQQANKQPEGCVLTKASIGHREETMLMLKLSPSQVQAMKAFLQTLNGKELPKELLTPPTLSP